MLKKILIFFISAHLCASENIKTPELSLQNNSFMKAIGTGLAAWVVYIIIPNLLADIDEEQLAEIIGAENVQKLASLAVAIACIYALKEIAYIGKDFYQYCYPDEKKKVLIRQAEERIAILDTKRAFRECLMKNAKGQRSNEGLPVACEECARAFAVTAGKAAFQDMAETFKRTYLRTDRLAQLDNKGVQKLPVPLLELMH